MGPYAWAESHTLGCFVSLRGYRRVNRAALGPVVLHVPSPVIDDWEKTSVRRCILPNKTTFAPLGTGVTSRSFDNHAIYVECVFFLVCLGPWATVDRGLW